MNTYWKEIFGWSWARQKAWDECRRRYYYTYIGKWEGFRGDPSRDRLHWLGRKTPWYMLEGQLAHEAIQSQVNQWAIGRDVNKAAAKNLFAYRLKEIQDSPHDFIVDEVNGFPITGSRYEECRKDGLALLDVFFDIIWPNYSDYDYVKHEEFDSFLSDDVLVRTKIDLVTKTKKGTVVVTDWKTSKPGEQAAENRKQVLAYILWAMHNFGVDESGVRGEVRYLRDPMAQGIVDASKKELEDFRKAIAQSAKEMLAVASASDFPAKPSDRVCKTCAYATVCPDGMQFIPDAAKSEPIVPVG